MTLGFTVEALVGAGRGGGALAMGLRRVPEAAWLRPHPDRATRAAAFDAHADAVRLLPEADAAGAETAAMLGVEGGLAKAARARWEDLCLLQPAADGQYRLTAGAVAFPTDWRLADKVGLPLTAVHAPIHGYAEQLADGVDHFFRTLPAGPVFGRANWFVVPTDAWRYLPTDDPAARFAHVTTANVGETLFVRCERQTIRRLPQTGALLFTIGIAVAPLDALSKAAVHKVAAGIAAQSAGEHERRAAPFYAAALAGYAAGRGEEPSPS
ncbi:heme-dependent oxidative N-demethylase family protein [Sphingomonas sp.]|uniref:heme-dependent oxidative N-demethylase family protein n=1 Tax=Sphingomonas sp. TaxID=28214 RepID=UPI003CC53A1D